MTKQKQYISILGNTKFCPILRGNNLETFRFYEALEAGCLPITNITDKSYLEWIEKHLQLESIYSWSNPIQLLEQPNITNEQYNKVMNLWKDWKKSIQDNCKKLVNL